jgi:hypothetical protein
MSVVTGRTQRLELHLQKDNACLQSKPALLRRRLRELKLRLEREIRRLSIDYLNLV